MAIARDNPITPQLAPDLEPLQRSHEADQLEQELKALGKLMFDTYIRPAERIANTAGTPHIADFSLVERAVKSEGLALYRKADQDVMRYLFRAWRARNPKRGLGLLKAYLQLFWPNGWECWRLWQNMSLAYPAGLSETKADNHFLTSRVQVYINSTTSDGSDVAEVASSLRSVVPAKVVLDVKVLTRNQINMGLANGLYGGVVQHLEGNFV